jgi:pyrimidine operon attenuation protein/uracil phosphoribosyltransferase
MEKEIILHAAQIAQKLNRMAYQIYELNHDVQQLTVIGIEEGGVIVAQNLIKILEKISPLTCELSSISLNKANPAAANTVWNGKTSLDNKNVLLIDDVANSGKTLFYALQPILQFKPKRLQVAVLVDREHKNFPIEPTIIGHKIATTLQDMIIVNYDKKKIISAHLE